MPAEKKKKKYVMELDLPDNSIPDTVGPYYVVLEPLPSITNNIAEATEFDSEEEIEKRLGHMKEHHGSKARFKTKD